MFLDQEPVRPVTGHRAAQAALGLRLLDRGWTCRQLADAVLGDLPDRLTAPLRRLRALLDLPGDASAPVILDDEGHAVPAVGMERHLLRGRASAAVPPPVQVAAVVPWTRTSGSAHHGSRTDGRRHRLLPPAGPSTAPNAS
ncbi:hypothetical protein [Streptomyces spinosisporus]|uniref:Uncharacterized protein n=1 Tax=Streptomyces spinosisporus TaxID=2927582 RepID=A0ABS9XIW1_9ACTN|nr:hypothetical protein [Streptomyces spinosisporus]MCI3242027.1 hypothetical protein [Streptomyces spinosisporus]